MLSQRYRIEVEALDSLRIVDTESNEVVSRGIKADERVTAWSRARAIRDGLNAAVKK